MATTYVIAATRAGQSAVVAETTTKTYAVALPAVLREVGSGGSGGGGGATTTVRVVVMA